MKIDLNYFKDRDQISIPRPGCNRAFKANRVVGSKFAPPQQCIKIYPSLVKWKGSLLSFKDRVQLVQNERNSHYRPWHAFLRACSVPSFVFICVG